MRITLMFVGVLVALRLQQLAVAPAASGGTALHNQAYVQGGSADQVLDLDTPASAGFATVIFIHGGSLEESGERRTSPVYAHVCEPFLAAAIACATIDYRLAPTHRWPAMPLDAAAAFKWVREKVIALKGDPSRVFVFGHSSGCQLAAVLGANPKYLASVGLTPSDVAGVIAMGCVLAPMEEATTRLTMEQLKARWPKMGETETYGTLEERLDSDPSRFIGPHMPPTLVVVAEAERFFPAVLEQGAKFVRRLLELQRPADLVIVPGKHYASIAALPTPNDPTFAAIKRFIADPAAEKGDVAALSSPRHGI
jgi:acetyl esterase/lipase